MTRTARNSPTSWIPSPWRGVPFPHRSPFHPYDSNFCTGRGGQCGRYSGSSSSLSWPGWWDSYWSASRRSTSRSTKCASKLVHCPKSRDQAARLIATLPFLRQSASSRHSSLKTAPRSISLRFSGLVHSTVMLDGDEARVACCDFRDFSSWLQPSRLGATTLVSCTNGYISMNLFLSPVQERLKTLTRTSRLRLASRSTIQGRDVGNSFQGNMFRWDSYIKWDTSTV